MLCCPLTSAACRCSAEQLSPALTLCSQVTAAIVTCGGLCPGLNDVIQNIVWTLDDYGVKEILGIRYGLSGFTDREWRPIQLNRQAPVQCGLLVRRQEQPEACQSLSLLHAGEDPQMGEWSRQTWCCAVCLWAGMGCCRLHQQSLRLLHAGQRLKRRRCL